MSPRYRFRAGETCANCTSTSDVNDERIASGIVDENCHFTHLACPLPPCIACGKRASHIDTLIVAIHGVCRDGGTPFARASFAVHVAKLSGWNFASDIEPYDSTSQEAVLRAAILALAQSAYYYEDKFLARPAETSLSQVVLKTDSEYLVKGMTESIHKWKETNFITAKGEIVQNGRFFHALDQQVGELKALGIEVFFWHVPRKFNKEAAALANSAFDAKEEQASCERLSKILKFSWS